MGNLFGNLFGGEGTDTSILFFFLLLVIIFSNCGMFEDSDTLLWFFLLLVVLFGGCGNVCGNVCGTQTRNCATVCN